jgi:hypothetical protein
MLLSSVNRSCGLVLALSEPKITRTKTYKGQLQRTRWCPLKGTFEPPRHWNIGLKRIRAGNAKEVARRTGAEETFRYPNQILIPHSLSIFTSLLMSASLSLPLLNLVRDRRPSRRLATRTWCPRWLPLSRVLRGQTPFGIPAAQGKGCKPIRSPSHLQWSVEPLILARRPWPTD